MRKNSESFGYDGGTQLTYQNNFFFLILAVSSLNRKTISKTKY